MFAQPSWAAEERVSGCVIVGDRSSTCLRYTFERGVRSESALYARYLPRCSRAGQGLFCVHGSFSVPFIRLSVSRHSSGLLRCVSFALHFSSVGASVHSSVSARAVPAKLSLQEGTIRGANLVTGVSPLAVPRSPGLSLGPCRSCVTLSGLFRRGGTFRWNLHDCFHFCIKNPCIWLCLARPLRSAERAGGTAGEVSEECGLCVCGSRVRFVVRWWLEKTGLSSCRAMNLSGSEL